MGRLQNRHDAALKIESIIVAQNLQFKSTSVHLPHITSKTDSHPQKFKTKSLPQNGPHREKGV